MGPLRPGSYLEIFCAVQQSRTDIFNSSQLVLPVVPVSNLVVRTLPLQANIIYPVVPISNTMTWPLRFASSAARGAIGHHDLQKTHVTILIICALSSLIY